MKECLNCGASTTEKFCCRCGQKTDTQRITTKHFIAHDLLHGVWHLDKGIFFTIKEAISRPGQAALDYINGRRIRYYNVFYLCLLLIGLNIIIVHFLQRFRLPANLNSDSNPIYRFLADNVKFIVLGIVPLLALNALLIFRRLKLNLSEHFIVAGMCLTGILIISSLQYIADFLSEISIGYFFGTVELLLFISIVLFPLWTYWNLNKYVYFGWRKLLRVIFFYIVLVIELLILLLSIVYYITNDTEIEFIM